jgi:hypothetical protein
MTIKVYMNDGTVEEYPNAHIYWEWDESEKGTDSGFRINSMDRNFNSSVAFVHPGECEKIEITSEECDKIFKSPPREDCLPVKRYKIFRAIHEERIRQDEKWGEQNHPMLNIPFSAEGMVEKERVYKRINDTKKDLSWFTILMEEVVAEKVVNKFVTEMGTDMKKLFENATIREDIRFYMRKNIEKMLDVIKERSKESL